MWKKTGSGYAAYGCDTQAFLVNNDDCWPLLLLLFHRIVIIFRCLIFFSLLPSPVIIIINIHPYFLRASRIDSVEVAGSSSCRFIL